jgi:hypothetical protein
MSRLKTTLWSTVLLSGTALSQQPQEPPLVRLDLLIIRVELGGSNAGIGVQPPRVGVDVKGVVGVSVGINQSPAPIYLSIESFTTCEVSLADVLTRIQALIRSGASAEQIQAAYLEAQRISEAKVVLAAMITPW